VTRPDAKTLPQEVTTLVFDLYGTVVDMQSGLTEIARPFLRAKNWSGEAHRFVTWWRRTHFENSMIDALCDCGHTPYREIGQRAVAFVMDRAGIDYTSDEARWLVSQIERLKPFADVPEALTLLKQRYRLAILSNGDRDMLEAARPHIGFEFDAMISVQEAGYFKPHFATYAKACEILQEKPSAILFVANHAFDCIGAKAQGMRTAFIDRRHRPFGETPHSPDLISEDFSALARIMCAED
jgi:2-haloacid dehalogenase